MRARGACLYWSGLLVATSFLNWPSRWALALRCLGLGWWAEFEREFKRLVSGGWRQQNPLRRRDDFEPRTIGAGKLAGEVSRSRAV